MTRLKRTESDCSMMLEELKITKEDEMEKVQGVK